ncbi:putative importin subunit beta-2 [Clavispora lusitaniae]|uniref:Importin subunit beta-2 n=2 Tax=Clavispora lusitaniae TaxID=36911 RepID=C4XWW1_CLAL4|nr:uncharacterized protein CLUG_00433 [Clavispora lusitaniae ATCC 42720]KAF7584347.1 HEAT repeats family protein [Clavispora lusitaniae]EEQ36310.1 hypothetical protein CLUG_00433 [Clavispora lusitaniae ATCC 42720]QFZ25347.1 putative importin subunit beta-2 [Clavispora lusitaniae]QFZ31350.1 putative importin subunit beta-2 [Clavispora lusitaniae]QFZ37018.1 putative importin subunit beta-2 [Clavispora lusitaniae]
MWTADPQALEQLAAIFKATLSSSKAERSSANDALASARLQPHFENYLCDLLVRDLGVSADVRAAAGINLKNCVLKQSSADRSYLLATIFAGLRSSHNMVRNITGNVITSLFSACGPSGWPQALPSLLDIAADESVPLPTREAAVSALAKICEDSGSSLDDASLAALAQQLLHVTQSPQASASLRSGAVLCLNQLVPLKSSHAFVEQYLQALFTLTGDHDSGVRKNVCSAFVSIMECKPQTLVPHMGGVVSFCVHSMQDENEDVAMEACEFLLTLADSPEKAHRVSFRPHLQQVVPVLLEKMVYSEEQIFLMQILDEKDDARVADRDEDVRPNAVRSKNAHSVSKTPAAKKIEQDSDADSDDDGDSDDDDDSDDELDSWNLRRCSAATLDALSLDYPQEVISVALPLLQEKIVSPEWPVREAAILAFGAISKSCVDLARDKLPTLVPFLVERMKDAETRVRSIACWTLSRYATWVCAEAHEGGTYSSYFPPTFEAVVGLALDKKKIVQEAACSALASFVETADVELLDRYVGALLAHFAQCFASYQRKNLLVLYDCVNTFVDKIGPEVFGRSPEYANTLLPPLFANWESLQDDDTDLWPLLECMSVVASTMGEAFAPYAVPVYERAVKILANAISLNQHVHTDPLIEAPEKDFIVTSLDLIDGLVQGFKAHSVELMKQHGANVMELVLVCFEDHDEDVRQSAYALLGDLAIFACHDMVQPYMDRIVVCIGHEINNRSYSSYAVTNNAIWSFGEIAIKADPDSIKPYVGNIVGLLVPLLKSADTQETLVENAAICLGRLGLAGGSPEIAALLPDFVYSWCAQMMYVMENEEKETAFLGFLNTLQLNPDQGLGGLNNQQGRKNLAVLVSCIGNYFEPSDKLKEMFYQVLMSYKSLLGDAWETQVLGLVDADTRGFLQTSYGV